MLALMLVVNILLLIALMAFCYKLNKDWSNLMMKMNADWLSWYKLTLRLYDKDEEDEPYEQ